MRVVRYLGGWGGGRGEDGLDDGEGELEAVGYGGYAVGGGVWSVMLLLERGSLPFHASVVWADNHRIFDCAIFSDPP